MLAGTIFTPIQSYAAQPKVRGPGADLPDTSSFKKAARDGISVNLEHREQHMDQENLCYRANICIQANDGQNTLGNDNSITGFADQSDNLQQAAVPTPITPTNQTTGNQTSGGGGGGTTN
jgi:hypothetical protein